MTDGIFWARLNDDRVTLDAVNPLEDVVSRLIRDLRISDCNESFAAFYGFPSAQACIGTPVLEFFPGRDLARSYFRRILTDGRVAEMVTRPGGGNEVNRVLMLCHLIREGQTVLGIQGINVQQAGPVAPPPPVSGLDRLGESPRGEPGFNLLLQAIEQCRECVVLADLAGTIVYANTAKANLMGIPKDKLIGTNVTVFGIQAQEKTEKEMEFATLKDGGWSGRLLRRRGDGRLIPVHMQTCLIRDANGQAVAQLRTFYDMSAESELHTQLEEASEALKSLVTKQTADRAVLRPGKRFIYEDSPVATLLTNAQGIVAQANPVAHRLLGFERDELIGKRLEELFHSPERCRELMERLGAVQRLTEEVEYRSPDGDVLCVEQSSVAVKTGAHAGLLVHFLKDVTRERRLAREAEEARQQVARADKLASIGQLVSGVAHELNNPLTGILTFAHMLRKEAPDASRTATDIDVILEAAERCREIVRGLLDFSRQSESRKRLCDLAQLLGEALDLTRNQALLKSIRVVVDTDERIPPVLVDPHQLEQVFVNLICNALDATAKGGELTIRSRQCPANGGEDVVMEFRDTGCGIPPNMLDSIFDPFFTTKPPGQGTGLGLAIAHGIVEQHGGSIGVTSTVGEGTTFTLRLPLTARTPDHEE